jgi:hypothetical protein
MAKPRGVKQRRRHIPFEYKASHNCLRKTGIGGLEMSFRIAWQDVRIVDGLAELAGYQEREGQSMRG